MSCLTDTTTCTPCNQSVSCDCPNGRVDAMCVQYTGADLDNLGVTSGEYLNTILQKINDSVFTQTNFVANTTDTIRGITGGTLGHSPMFEVRIDPDEDNAIEVTSLGLFVSPDNMGDGKVKVDASDPKDYLKNQLSPGTDGIVTITPTVIAGVVYMVPSIDIPALLQYIKENHKELLCQIAAECIPNETTTTSTTTTSTTSTSTTTTTTTTVAPNDFDISNNSGVSVPFTIFFTDEVSLIDYVVDNTTGNGQFTHYEYVGTTNQSTLTIQHSPSVSVGIQVFVDSIEIYDSINTVGSVVIPNIDPRSDVFVNLNQPPATTTTSTSSTTTTSTSSTTTTTTSTSTTSTTTTSTTTESQAYYLADAYQCGTCININDDVLVSLPVSHTLQIGKFYVPVVDDGNVYTIVSTTPQSPGPAVALTTANFNTCAGACA